MINSHGYAIRNGEGDRFVEGTPPSDGIAADFERAEYHANKIAEVNPNCRLYLQPEWSERKKLTPLIVEYIKQNPKWKISQQTHKYIDIR